MEMTVSNRLTSHWTSQRIELHAWAPQPSRGHLVSVALCAWLRRQAPRSGLLVLSPHLRRDLGLADGAEGQDWTREIELRRCRI
jgi:hypothetical protein